MENKTRNKIGLTLLLAVNVTLLCMFGWILARRITFLLDEPGELPIKRMLPKPEMQPEMPKIPEAAQAPQETRAPEPKTAVAKTPAKTPGAQPDEIKPESQAKKRDILFQYWDYQAKSVAVIGDFTGGKPVPLKFVRKNLWEIPVPIAPGKHSYQFLINGQAYPDPNNPNRKGKKSIIEVQPSTQ